MTKDYRNTEYCPVLEKVSDKKDKLEKKIHKECPKTKVFHNKVKDRDGQYYSEFSEIYNHKCAYCGTSYKNIGINQFEIDHYVYEKSFATTEEAGHLSNLVYSCYDCNRSKSSLLIEDTYVDELNPDNGNIAQVFNRDEDFSIKINENYETDEFVQKFYDKLHFGFQTRRLDYLLLSLRGLYEKISDKPEAKDLLEIIDKLQSKRNLY